MQLASIPTHSSLSLGTHLMDPQRLNDSNPSITSVDLSLDFMHLAQLREQALATGVLSPTGRISPTYQFFDYRKLDFSSIRSNIRKILTQSLVDIMISQRSLAQRTWNPIQHFEIVGSAALWCLGEKNIKTIFSDPALKFLLTPEFLKKFKKKPRDIDLQAVLLNSSYSEIEKQRAIVASFFMDLPAQQRSWTWKDWQRALKAHGINYTESWGEKNFCLFRIPHSLEKTAEYDYDYAVGGFSHFCLFTNSNLHIQIEAKSLDDLDKNFKVWLVSQNNNLRETLLHYALDIIEADQPALLDYRAALGYLSKLSRGGVCYNSILYSTILKTFLNHCLFRGVFDTYKAARVLQNITMAHHDHLTEARLAVALEFERSLYFAEVYQRRLVDSSLADFWHALFPAQEKIHQSPIVNLRMLPGCTIAYIQAWLQLGSYLQLSLYPKNSSTLYQATWRKHDEILIALGAADAVFKVALSIEQCLEIIIKHEKSISSQAIVEIGNILTGFLPLEEQKSHLSDLQIEITSPQLLIKYLEDFSQSTSVYLHLSVAIVFSCFSVPKFNQWREVLFLSTLPILFKSTEPSIYKLAYQIAKRVLLTNTPSSQVSTVLNYLNRGDLFSALVATYQPVYSQLIVKEICDFRRTVALKNWEDLFQQEASLLLLNQKKILDTSNVLIEKNVCLKLLHYMAKKASKFSRQAVPFIELAMNKNQIDFLEVVDDYLKLLIFYLDHIEDYYQFLLSLITPSKMIVWLEKNRWKLFSHKILDPLSKKLILETKTYKVGFRLSHLIHQTDIQDLTNLEELLCSSNLWKDFLLKIQNKEFKVNYNFKLFQENLNNNFKKTFKNLKEIISISEKNVRLKKCLFDFYKKLFSLFENDDYQFIEESNLLLKQLIDINFYLLHKIFAFYWKFLSKKIDQLNSNKSPAFSPALIFSFLDIIQLGLKSPTLCSVDGLTQKNLVSFLVLLQQASSSEPLIYLKFYEQLVQEGILDVFHSKIRMNRKKEELQIAFQLAVENNYLYAALAILGESCHFSVCPFSHSIVLLLFKKYIAQAKYLETNKGHFVFLGQILRKGYESRYFEAKTQCLCTLRWLKASLSFENIKQEKWLSTTKALCEHYLLNLAIAEKYARVSTVLFIAHLLENFPKICSQIQFDLSSFLKLIDILNPRHSQQRRALVILFNIYQSTLNLFPEVYAAILKKLALATRLDVSLISALMINFKSYLNPFNFSIERSELRLVLQFLQLLWHEGEEKQALVGLKKILNDASSYPKFILSKKEETTLVTWVRLLKSRQKWKETWEVLCFIQNHLSGTSDILSLRRSLSLGVAINALQDNWITPILSFSLEDLEKMPTALCESLSQGLEQYLQIGQVSEILSILKHPFFNKFLSSLCWILLWRNKDLINEKQHQTLLCELWNRDYFYLLREDPQQLKNEEISMIADGMAVWITMGSAYPNLAVVLAEWLPEVISHNNVPDCIKIKLVDSYMRALKAKSVPFIEAVLLSIIANIHFNKVNITNNDDTENYSEVLLSDHIFDILIQSFDYSNEKILMNSLNKISLYLILYNKCKKRVKIEFILDNHWKIIEESIKNSPIFLKKYCSHIIEIIVSQGDISLIVNTPDYFIYLLNIDDYLNEKLTFRIFYEISKDRTKLIQTVNNCCIEKLIKWFQRVSKIKNQECRNLLSLFSELKILSVKELTLIEEYLIIDTLDSFLTSTISGNLRSLGFEICLTDASSYFCRPCVSLDNKKKIANKLMDLHVVRVFLNKKLPTYFHYDTSRMFFAFYNPSLFIELKEKGLSIKIKDKENFYGPEALLKEQTYGDASFYQLCKELYLHKIVDKYCKQDFEKSKSILLLKSAYQFLLYYIDQTLSSACLDDFITVMEKFIFACSFKELENRKLHYDYVRELHVSLLRRNLYKIQHPIFVVSTHLIILEAPDDYLKDKKKSILMLKNLAKFVFDKYLNHRTNYLIFAEKFIKTHVESFEEVVEIYEMIFEIPKISSSFHYPEISNFLDLISCIQLKVQDSEQKIRLATLNKKFLVSFLHFINVEEAFEYFGKIRSHVNRVLDEQIFVSEDKKTGSSLLKMWQEISELFLNKFAKILEKCYLSEIVLDASSQQIVVFTKKCFFRFFWEYPIFKTDLDICYFYLANNFCTSLSCNLEGLAQEEFKELLDQKGLVWENLSHLISYHSRSYRRLIATVLIEKYGDKAVINQINNIQNLLKNLNTEKINHIFFNFLLCNQLLNICNSQTLFRSLLDELTICLFALKNMNHERLMADLILDCSSYIQLADVKLANQCLVFCQEMFISSRVPYTSKVHIFQICCANRFFNLLPSEQEKHQFILQGLHLFYSPKLFSSIWEILQANRIELDIWNLPILDLLHPWQKQALLEQAIEQDLNCRKFSLIKHYITLFYPFKQSFIAPLIYKTCRTLLNIDQKSCKLDYIELFECLWTEEKFSFLREHSFFLTLQEIKEFYPLFSEKKQCYTEVFTALQRAHIRSIASFYLKDSKEMHLKKLQEVLNAFNEVPDVCPRIAHHLCDPVAELFMQLLTACKYYSEKALLTRWFLKRGTIHLYQKLTPVIRSDLLFLLLASSSRCYKDILAAFQPQKSYSVALKQLGVEVFFYLSKCVTQKNLNVAYSLSFIKYIQYLDKPYLKEDWIDFALRKALEFSAHKKTYFSINFLKSLRNKNCIDRANFEVYFQHFCTAAFANQEFSVCLYVFKNFPSYDLPEDQILSTCQYLLKLPFSIENFKDALELINKKQVHDKETWNLLLSSLSHHSSPELFEQVVQTFSKLNSTCENLCVKGWINLLLIALNQKLKTCYFDFLIEPNYLNHLVKLTPDLTQMQILYSLIYKYFLNDSIKSEIFFKLIELRNRIELSLEVLNEIKAHDYNLIKHILQLQKTDDKLFGMRHILNILRSRIIVGCLSLEFKEFINILFKNSIEILENIPEGQSKTELMDLFQSFAQDCLKFLPAEVEFFKYSTYLLKMNSTSLAFLFFEKGLMIPIDNWPNKGDKECLNALDTIVKSHLKEIDQVFAFLCHPMVNTYLPNLLISGLFALQITQTLNITITDGEIDQKHFEKIWLQVTAYLKGRPSQDYSFFALTLLKQVVYYYKLTMNIDFLSSYYKRIEKNYTIDRKPNLKSTLNYSFSIHFLEFIYNCWNHNSFLALQIMLLYWMVEDNHSLNKQTPAIQQHCFSIMQNLIKQYPEEHEILAHCLLYLLTSYKAKNEKELLAHFDKFKKTFDRSSCSQIWESQKAACYVKNLYINPFQFNYKAVVHLTKSQKLEGLHYLIGRLRDSPYSNGLCYAFQIVQSFLSKKINLTDLEATLLFTALLEGIYSEEKKEIKVERISSLYAIQREFFKHLKTLIPEAINFLKKIRTVLLTYLNSSENRQIQALILVDHLSNELFLNFYLNNLNEIYPHLTTFTITALSLLDLPDKQQRDNAIYAYDHVLTRLSDHLSMFSQRIENFDSPLEQWHRNLARYSTLGENYSFFLTAKARLNLVLKI